MLLEKLKRSQKENAHQNKWMVYPTLVYDITRIHTPLATDKFTVCIQNIDDEIILESGGCGITDIDMSKFEKGIYNIYVEYTDGQYYCRVLKR
ncbi:hypothetical protein [Flammeovirga kamogawensis]|uniref:T9SS type A sorting domain-containing protein n=1 Tax=Flammeovirga kamogawensis TaxID=373891 RepID=A0ABX8H228_9BACT|nr:hypothetical protein [Flammeovirga kamogawensis]MBB6460148.1 hypothetical protein [Flammeovirga kamogawensis]QWG09961.1 hypothetical protein KM029_19970 [Flammeovirga kamogawensis]TRX65468.1 hypothetical protein EO216_23395 [Flammeovirga kamogawensis]